MKDKIKPPCHQVSCIVHPLCSGSGNYGHAGGSEGGLEENSQSFTFRPQAKKNCVEQVIANLHEDVWEEGVGEVDQREVSVSHLARFYAICLWCLGGEIPYRSLI